MVFWQPTTALIKFYRDGIYETSCGKEKVKELRKRRGLDLAASRADLIETSIEATFEPLVQGYIIFPSIIVITKNLQDAGFPSIFHTPVFKDVDELLELNIQFKMSPLQQTQLFSIATSIMSLAWTFSDSKNVSKHLQLDICVSPASRILMCIWMILQLTARLLAFMLFAVYWGPGYIYPLMIFVAVHTVLAGFLHVVFSEDIAFWKKGCYFKFFQNVILNSFASLYFHNYLRFDKMPNAKILQIAGM